ncbi:hypothetical protein MMC13_006844 [Lambiella insularis]|nr:hypothetical protein [Lambiella insularis]
MSYPPPQGAHPPYGAPPPGQYPHYPQYPQYQAQPGQPFQGCPQQQQPYMYGGVAPPQQQHGAYPQQQYSASPYRSEIPTPASPGYGPQYVHTPVETTYVVSVADTLRKAMKGFGTDEGALIRSLCHFEAHLVPHLNQTFQQRHFRSLEKDVEKETSGHFRFALLSILRGPLRQDVFLLDKALKGIGTNECLLNDVVIARSNADLNAIKHAYHASYNRTLESAVSNDLSAKTQRLFSMVLMANRREESRPVLPHEVDGDVIALHGATEGKFGTDELNVCSILSNRSDGHIRAIALAYNAKYALPLEQVLKKEFSGHMQVALIQMVRAASDPVMRDAVLIEDCMKNMGTKDEMLVSRIVRSHWAPDHMDQVRKAYKMKYGKDLIQRIKGETSGDYQRLLVAMVEPGQKQGSMPSQTPYR